MFALTITEGFDADEFVAANPGFSDAERELISAATLAAHVLVGAFPGEVNVLVRGHANAGFAIDATGESADANLQITVTQAREEIPEPLDTVSGPGADAPLPAPAPASEDPKPSDENPTVDTVPVSQAAEVLTPQAVAPGEKPGPEPEPKQPKKAK